MPVGWYASVVSGEVRSAPSRRRISVDDKAPSIEGTITRVLYYQPETGWTSLRVNIGAAKDAAIVGNVTTVPVTGMRCSALGRWTRHEKFGDQFQANTLDLRPPGQPEPFARYLMQLMPGLALRDALDVANATGCDLDKNEGIRGSGIDPGLAEEIIAVWASVNVDAAAVDFLRDSGFPSSLAVSTVRHFVDSDVIELVKENPYRLVEAPGVEFAVVDEMAKRLGVQPSSENRIVGGLVEATRADGDNGHTIVPRSELVAAAAELLGLRPAAVDPIVAIAIEKHGLVRRAETDCGEAYQLPSTFRAERNLARAVVDFVRPVSVRQRPSRDQIAQAFPFQPNEQQLLAVERAFTNGLSLILGGPGTGKTATTRAIRMLFKGPTAGLAPTGVAAKRQEVATGYPSGTIHRGLRARPTAGGGFYFVHHAGNPLPLENGALVTDEIGMLDTFLAASLLTAVPHSCNVIGVGDIGQLASVGPGNVLSDLIDVGVPCTELTEIYRTGQGSPIPYIAREIMAGRVPELDATGDARFIETANTEAPSDLLGVVKGMTSGGIAAENIAVMTPTKGGPFGSDVLNQWLQRLWNPGGFDRGCVPNGAVFAGHGGEKQEEVLCIGDRVMQMRNDYELEIYNGDIMTVLDVDNRKKPTVYVRVDDGRELALSGAAALRNVRLAYASTVHKRQGDQVQHAVVALLRQHGRMLHRKLVNTAITRAQYSVTIVGERIALDMAANDYGLQPDKDGAGHAFERRTGLRELITAEFDERQRIA